jgi:hypothetical protein
MKITIVLFGLSMVLGCRVDTETKHTQASAVDPNRSVTVFLTGQELGRLKPCGCSGGQLGGLERRGAIIDQIPATRRLVINTGSVVPTDSDQDLIKFSVFFQAYQALRYDVVHLTDQDRQNGRATGLFQQSHDPIRFIGSQASPDMPLDSESEHSFLLGDSRLAIRIIAASQDTSLATNVNPSELRIFILNSPDPALVESVLQVADAWDCVILPSELDEPKIHDFPGEQALVLSIGRFGRFVGRLDILPASNRRGFEFHFQGIKVSEELTKDPDLVELYKNYQAIVGHSDLLESFIRFPLAGTATYLGSAACKECHKETYDSWRKTKHGHAYATLEQAGSQRDPECVACHVIGMESEQGFINREQTPKLMDVGCEVCHGPGSEHVAAIGLVKTGHPKRACLHCHTPEHSGGFAGHEMEYMEKIRHWMEPNAKSNVE